MGSAHWSQRCGYEQKAPSVDVGDAKVVDRETLEAWRGWEMGRGYLPPQPTKGSEECRKLPQRGPGRN